MTMDLFLADYNGALCVVWRSIESDSPRRVDSYYPSTAETRYFCRYYEIDESRLSEFAVEAGRYNGEYRLSHQTLLGRGVGSVLALTNGAQTLPIHTDIGAIDPPKTKLPTKWRNGQWFKETKRGWALA